jgi:hypothetical protein
MKKNFQVLVALFSLYLFSSCSVENDVSQPIQTATPTKKPYTYLALGDSYTIGESVCETCRFPAQLSKKLEFTSKKYIFPSNNCANRLDYNQLAFIATQNPLPITI